MREGGRKSDEREGCALDEGVGYVCVWLGCELLFGGVLRLGIEGFSLEGEGDRVIEAHWRVRCV